MFTELVEAIMNPEDLQDDFTKRMRDEHLYIGAKRLSDGTYVGLQRLMYTVAICIGVDEMTAFTRRYCYDDFTQCLVSYKAIENAGDVPEGWIAKRPKLED